MKIRGIEQAVMGLVMAEVERAGEKFGPQLELTDDAWLAVLVEEVGEAAEVINERRLNLLPQGLAGPALTEEVLQVAAVAIRWLAAMGARP